MQETLPCPTFLDDLTVMMEADSYESLVVKLAMVTEGTSRIASDFGFQLNLAPGKTEAVVSWVGPGSRPIRRRLMALSNHRQVAVLPLNMRLDDDGDLQLPALAENDRAARIVQSHPRLGTIVQVGAGKGREIASHANAGQAATHALAWRLLGNEGLPRHVRVQVAHRPPPPRQSWKSNDEVQKELQVAELKDELACMRLLYMARAARLAPPYVLAMLQTMAAAAAWRRVQLLSPKLGALGSRMKRQHDGRSS